MEDHRKPVLSTHTQEESQTELQESIRRRAYDLYEIRGREDGHDTEDWLQAEAELSPQHARKVAA